MVQEDTGRNETIGLSFFSDTELLEPGLSIFSLAAGFRRDQFRQFSSTQYGGSPVLTGLYQRGITDRLTLGASLQADRDNALITTLAVIGTPIGLFGVEGAVDRNSTDKLQTALLLSFRLAMPGKDGRQNRFDIDFQTRTRRFSPMEKAGLTQNRYRYDITARYQTGLPYDIYATFGAGFSKGRDDQRDPRTVNAGASRNFGRFNVSLNYLYRTGTRGDDHRGTFSVTVPISSRQLARGNYDTSRNRFGMDYSLQGYEGLNQTSAQVSLARDDDGRSANIEVEHFSNRFRAAVRHTYDHTGGLSVQSTDFAITTGVGYADGVWAIGGDPDQGFVIVKPHPTLRDAQITVSNRYTLGPSAKSGLLGPALVPLQRVYQPDSLEVDVPDLRPGYDIGAGRFDVLPGAGSGYLWVIGSAASNTVLGRILSRDGTPAQFLAGTLQPISGAEAVAVPFFTNRNGRMAALKVAPRPLRRSPAGGGSAIGEVEVTPSGDGIIHVGVLRIKE